MSKIYPFNALRPGNEYLEHFSVSFAEVEEKDELLNRIKQHPVNFLQIHKPSFVSGKELSIDESQKISKSTLNAYLKEGKLIEEGKPCFFIYRQINGPHTYTGMIALASVEEYLDGSIKRHELTRVEKENKMLDYFSKVRINGSPVLLTYEDDKAIDKLIEGLTKKEPDCHYVSDDNTNHVFWHVCDSQGIEAIQQHYAQIKNLYIADGHHRSAAFSRMKNPGPGFMACIVPAGQLNIYGFHRLITDTEGIKRKKILFALTQRFEVKEIQGSFTPAAPGIIYAFMKKKWYEIKIPDSLKQHDNAKENLDVSILDKYILHDILKIKDSRTSTKIQYVNGITDLDKLAEQVRNKKARIAFALYPVSINDVIQVSDEGMTMPPKSTWIEPKMRSGLIIHKF